MSKKKSSKLFKFMPLKRRKKKEVKENPNLVADERFQCLVALGGEKETSFSHFITFPLTNFTKFFSSHSS
jgi:hypothetical protein